MARPRQFDEAAALDAAVQCFWARGYEATSVRDLAARMGITGASLYNAFGDKGALYRRAVDHYVAQSFGERARRLEGSLPPREAIAAFFAEMVERSLADREHRGCLLVNSSLEAEPRDPAFREAVAGMLGEIEAFFRRCVEAGQRDGTVSIAQPSEDLARMLLAVQLGLRVLARSRPDRDLLEGLVRPALAALDSPQRVSDPG